MNIKKIIEEIDELTKEPTSEEVLQDIPAEEPEVAPTFNDGMSLADTFDTKAKIARSLENLKQAVEEFKEATAEKVDLLQDELLLGEIEKLGETIQGIELALASGSNLLGSELNDPFKSELPQAEEQPAEEEAPAEEKTEEEESDEDAEFDGEDYDFDDEAGLNLFNPEV